MRRPQFRLRTLFLWLTLVCCVLAGAVEFLMIDHAQLTYSAQFGWDFYLAWKGRPPPEAK